jgi:hypothetical protein
LLSFLFISYTSVKAEIGVGITGAYHMFDVSGTETTRTSGEKNTGSHSEDVIVPELFLEAIIDNGAAVGIAYIPTRDMGSKSRTDTNPTSADSGNDAGTYKASAELDNVVQFYLDYPFAEAYGSTFYGKVGVQHATIVTLESLNSGSTYPNEDVLGLTLGVGAKGDLPYGNNLYYKADVAYTNFEDYSENDEAGTGNKVEADLEDIALKFSLGYKF